MECSTFNCGPVRMAPANRIDFTDPLRYFLLVPSFSSLGVGCSDHLSGRVRTALTVLGSL